MPSIAFGCVAAYHADSAIDWLPHTKNIDQGELMYHHIKKLMYTVNVGTPDPRFGNICSNGLVEQTANSRPRCSIQSKD